MIYGDELGYIAWDRLDEEDCRSLIEYATERLRELAGEEGQLTEYREWMASWHPAYAKSGEDTG